MWLILGGANIEKLSKMHNTLPQFFFKKNFTSGRKAWLSERLLGYGAITQARGLLLPGQYLLLEG